MNAADRKFVDRKDLARMLDLTVRQVAGNEKQLGIAPARVNLNSRTIRYHRTIAIRGLEKTGNLPKDEGQ